MAALSEHMKTAKMILLTWVVAFGGLACGFGITTAAAQAAAPAYDKIAQTNLQQVSTARFTKWLWDVYDATLYLPTEDTANLQTTPLALKLTYLRKLSGAKICEKSLELMAAQAPLTKNQRQKWDALMRQQFPDVQAGDTITGVRDADGHTTFIINGKPQPEITDQAFGRRFFNIWLGEATAEPELRATLLENTPFSP